MSTKDVEAFLRRVKEGGFKVWRGVDTPSTPPPHTHTLGHLWSLPVVELLLLTFLAVSSTLPIPGLYK